MHIIRFGRDSGARAPKRLQHLSGSGITSGEGDGNDRSNKVRIVTDVLEGLMFLECRGLYSKCTLMNVRSFHDGISPLCQRHLCRIIIGHVFCHK